MKIHCRITSEIHPTEDLEKVEKAVLNIFPKAEIKVEERRLNATFDSLEGFEKLRMLIWSRRIRNSARAVLLQGIREGSVTFYLNKQAAYVGKISFYEEGETMALGPIKVVATTDDPRRFVEWLTSASSTENS